jgi:hypothetical protein
LTIQSIHLLQLTTQTYLLEILDIGQNRVCLRIMFFCLKASFLFRTARLKCALILKHICAYTNSVSTNHLEHSNKDEFIKSDNLILWPKDRSLSKPITKERNQFKYELEGHNPHWKILIGSQIVNKL